MKHRSKSKIKNPESHTFFHIVYYRDFLEMSLPYRDILISIGLYDNKEKAIEICKKQNEFVLNMERFRVYSSPTKKLTNQSYLIYQ